MQKMKAGIIGCGNISAVYLNNLRKSPVIEVVALADMLAERAQARAEEFGIENVYTVDEMLQREDIELIINLTVPGSHAMMNTAALEAGKHVYGEKPFSVSLEDGRRVLELAEKKGLYAGCAPDTFLGAGIQTARRAILDGLIGKPIAATAFFMGRGPEWWHHDPEFFYASGGGPMFDMGPYYLTALVTLLGPIRRVSASAGIQIPDRKIHTGPKGGTPLRVQTPTHLAGTLDFSNGAIASMITSFDIRGTSDLPRMEIYGTEGTLSVPDPNDFSGEVKLRRFGEEEWVTIEPVFECSVNERGLGANEMVNAIRAGRKHQASGELGYHVLEAMRAFEKSSLDGKHIQLESTYTQDEDFRLDTKLLPQPKQEQ
ncbi:Gfo/Idh/MocA family oxidoreductase [Paenibacillus sp. JX-17]|uniref:Gfo/Idh/MocA family oxidoreductase n=1 Tax=Paenibacillus lacisoli TaxID=3064525 RepID=A0ABT9C7G9_9BACL|nr:Gfo/Idh/MocA family oxidoreductase [Paenibacillus sp. JX-17]MDO7905207.1 Gfo/Idh/MocA family oxidoreductase [Paenibacillus sp. JX-17]